MAQLSDIISTNDLPLLTERFTGTDKLCIPAKTFKEKGVYTDYPKNTRGYIEFWKEQYHYCINGFEANGIKITGRHYFYLNFCPIFLLEEGQLRKTSSLPRFYDYDKYYFDKVDEAIKLRKGICLLKGRRKGFSFKGASLLAYEYTFVPYSVSFVGAYLDTYANNTFTYAKNMLYHLVQHTEFGKQTIKDTAEKIVAGYKKKDKTIGGSKSTIEAICFRDNAGKAIGNSANLFLFEEFGKFPNGLSAYLLTEPLFKEGNIFIGLPIIQGTAGDLEEGVSDFAEFFYNPNKYNMLSVENVWDADMTKGGREVGLFFPSYYGHNGVYGESEFNQKKEYFGKKMIDADGNSIIEVAYQDILDKRQQLSLTGSEKARYIYTTENPTKPSEAFMVGSSHLFNLERLNAQLSKILSHASYLPQKGRLEWEIINGVVQYDKVKWIPDENGKILIWEHPDEFVTSQSKVYLSGIDPVDISLQKKMSYHSNGAMFVFKTIQRPIEADCDVSKWHEHHKRLYNAIVCEYIDRPNNVEEFYETTLKINTYYKCNNSCMVENNKKNIIDFYAKHNKLLTFLHGSPEILEAKLQYKPSIKVGVTLTEEVKQVALEYLVMFMEKYTEHIFSKRLLEELLLYNNRGNFDAVSAFLMIIFMFEERQLKIKRANMVKQFVSLPMYRYENGKIIKD